MRLWRIHDSWPPFMEFIYSKPSEPDTSISYWDIWVGTQYGPNMFCIRDRKAGDKIRFSIDANGNVGIGMHTTPASYPLQMANGAYLDGIKWYEGSSREYKENIRELTKEEAVVAFNKLNPVTL